jgi:hypothetical protein
MQIHHKWESTNEGFSQLSEWQSLLVGISIYINENQEIVRKTVFAEPSGDK